MQRGFLFGVATGLVVLACGDDTANIAGHAAGGEGGEGLVGGAGASAPTGGSAQGGAGGEGGAPIATKPAVGAHGLAYFGYGANQLTSIDSPALATAASGSTIIVSAGRGDLSAFTAPTDNKGNGPYAPVGEPHPYTLWSSSGTAVYSFVGAVGGSGHVVSNETAAGDEITMAVVEVTGSTAIHDAQWVERLEGDGPITSGSVTTTGPATLVAFWWGDAGVDEDKVAVPNNGFTVLDSIGDAGALVQCFVAAKEVDAPGTYDVTWDATPAQGAQLWLLAVQ